MGTWARPNPRREGKKVSGRKRIKWIEESHYAVTVTTLIPISCEFLCIYSCRRGVYLGTIVHELTVNTMN